MEDLTTMESITFGIQKGTCIAQTAAGYRMPRKPHLVEKAPHSSDLRRRPSRDMSTMDDKSDVARTYNIAPLPFWQALHINTKPLDK